METQTGHSLKLLGWRWLLGQIGYFSTQWVLSSFSRVRLFATPWIVVWQALLSTGILWATILGWVTMPSSRESSRPRDRSWVSYVSCIGRWVLYHWHQLWSPCSVDFLQFWFKCFEDKPGFFSCLILYLMVFLNRIPISLSFAAGSPRESGDFMSQTHFCAVWSAGTLLLQVELPAPLLQAMFEISFNLHSFFFFFFLNVLS